MTTDHTTTTAEDRQHAARAAARAEHTELVGDIHDVLDQLLDLARLIRDLNSTRQRTGLGFLTAAARDELDKATRHDRQIRRSQPDRLVGLNWLNRDTIVSGTGTVPAAVTIPALSADAEIAAALHHHVRRVHHSATTRGLCLLQKIPTDPDTGDLITHLASIVWAAQRLELRVILRDLEHLAQTADHAANGPAQTYHDDPCPHCGQHSLVIHHRGPHGDTIRCEIARDARTPHPCVCDDAYCDCHRHPIRTRHEWHRTHLTAPTLRHTWSALSNLLTINRELTAMETKALDSVQRIRQLHQPGWYDNAGTWHDHYLVVPGDQVPADHVCQIGPADVEPQCHTADNPAHSTHLVLGCIECRRIVADHDEPGSALYPCPTIRALDDPLEGEAPTSKEN